MTVSVPTLGPFKRYVTGHNAEGKAIHIRSSDVETEPIPGSKLKDKTKVLFTTLEVPVQDNSVMPEKFTDPMDAGAGSLANKTGTVLRVVDFPPHEDGVSLTFGRDMFLTEDEPPHFVRRLRLRAVRRDRPVRLWCGTSLMPASSTRASASR
jgi:hypothetical protein